MQKGLIRLPLPWHQPSFPWQDVASQALVQAGPRSPQVLSFLQSSANRAAFCSCVKARRPISLIIENMVRWAIEQVRLSSEQEQLAGLACECIDYQEISENPPSQPDFQRSVKVSSMQSRLFEDDSVVGLEEDILDKLVECRSIRETEQVLKENGLWPPYDGSLTIPRELVEDRMQDNLLLEEWIDELTQGRMDQ